MFNARKNRKRVDELLNFHINSVKECKKKFDEFILFTFENGYTHEAEKLLWDVDALESEADSHRREIINLLIGGALLPDTRKDILTLIEDVDQIADNYEGISKEMFLQKIEFPEFVKNNIMLIEEKERTQLFLLCEAIDNLFLNLNDNDANRNIISQIELIESEIDKIEFNTVKEIYNLELDLAKKTQLRTFVSSIADVSDLIENISDILEMIIASRRA